MMTHGLIPRRRFLAGAAAAAGGFVGRRSAQAQGTAPVPATPLVRPADTILENGKVVTVDAAFTIAQSIAITGDRIAAVGPDEAVAAHAGPATRVVDLKGRTVVPGLIDGHAHMDREALRSEALPGRLPPTSAPRRPARCSRASA
jgi:hypothetical protein